MDRDSGRQYRGQGRTWQGTGVRKEELADGDATRETYTSGKDGTEVVLITAIHGGHEWPKAAGMQATDLMWDFFAAHPKPADPPR